MTTERTSTAASDGVREDLADPADDLVPAPEAAGDSGDGTMPNWAWVREWAASDEPPATAPGVTVAVFTGLLVGVAILTLTLGMRTLPILAVLANVLIAAGLAPALWYSRRVPVLRFVAAGAAGGLLVGWIAALAA